MSGVPLPKGDVHCDLARRHPLTKSGVVIGATHFCTDISIATPEPRLLPLVQERVEFHRSDSLWSHWRGQF